MIRLRLLLLVTGVGALFSGLPCSAMTSPDGELEGRSSSPSAGRALDLLQAAVRAAHGRTWSGTQHVLSVRDGHPSFTVLELSHTPSTGSSVQVLSSESGEGATTPDVLDSRLLGLLAGHYDLSVGGREPCAGRIATLVEARRPGQSGPAAVAGRFWLDTATHLVLRREVLDQDGVVIRSSALVGLRVGEAAPRTWGLQPLRPGGRHLDDEALRRLADEGWPVVGLLPSGLQLFESRMHERDGSDVLQLSYSDGLSTLSLFVQRGELREEPEGTARSVGDGTVWVSRGSPERVVWAGEGRTWTLVSDAPSQAVSDAVLVLPHTAGASGGDGVGSRLWRGMSRVGAWLNPFT